MKNKSILNQQMQAQQQVISTEQIAQILQTNQLRSKIMFGLTMDGLRMLNEEARHGDLSAIAVLKDFHKMLDDSRAIVRVAV